MVISQPKSSRNGSALITELFIALVILAIAAIPLSHGFIKERHFNRSLYFRAIAMEIVDGEMEILAAGQWRAFSPGVHLYEVGAHAATNLPPGKFQLAVSPGKVRLEWIPNGRGQARVAREIALP